MELTATQLRANLFKTLDAILETGEAVEIIRHGRKIRITADPPTSRMARLTPHPDAIIGDPEDLVHMDWSKEWKPFI